MQRVISRYLELVDAALPGRIESLYLVGSLALADYQPGRSDIDFVALTAGPLTSDEMDHLERVHETLLGEGSRPWFDGIYLPAAALACNPAEIDSVPHSHEGRFQRSRGFEANPAVWLTLRNHPLPIRGTLPKIWHDPDALRAWTLTNLNTYWADLATQLERAATRLTEEAASSAIGWCVPGVARLAYTLATGDVTSKSGACRYALTVYPERWHPIIGDALAIRTGSSRAVATSPSRVDDTIAFMRRVIETENARL